MNKNTALFQLLADESRLAILAALREGEQPVGAISARVGIAQSGVSRHLRLLSEAGVVAMRRDGQRHLYRLLPEPFLRMDDWLGSYRALWSARLDWFAGALAAKQLEEWQKEWGTGDEDAANGR